MKRNIFLLCLILCIGSASFAQNTLQKQDQQPKLPDSSAYAKSDINYKIIDGADQSFGYDIYVDGRLMIHQPSAPALPGNTGFKTTADAAKVAGLVIKKIRKGEMPPTVTTDELKKLKVIK